MPPASTAFLGLAERLRRLQQQFDSERRKNVSGARPGGIQSLRSSVNAPDRVDFSDPEQHRKFLEAGLERELQERIKREGINPFVDPPFQRRSPQESGPSPTSVPPVQERSGIQPLGGLAADETPLQNNRSTFGNFEQSNRRISGRQDEGSPGPPAPGGLGGSSPSGGRPDDFDRGLTQFTPAIRAELTRRAAERANTPGLDGPGTPLQRLRRAEEQAAQRRQQFGPQTGPPTPTVAESLGINRRADSAARATIRALRRRSQFMTREEAEGALARANENRRRQFGEDVSPLENFLPREAPPERSDELQAIRSSGTPFSRSLSEIETREAAIGDAARRGQIRQIEADQSLMDIAFQKDQLIEDFERSDSSIRSDQARLESEFERETLPILDPETGEELGRKFRNRFGEWDVLDLPQARKETTKKSSSKTAFVNPNDTEGIMNLAFKELESTVTGEKKGTADFDPVRFQDQLLNKFREIQDRMRAAQGVLGIVGGDTGQTAQGTGVSASPNRSPKSEIQTIPGTNTRINIPKGMRIVRTEPFRGSINVVALDQNGVEHSLTVAPRTLSEFDALPRDTNVLWPDGRVTRKTTRSRAEIPTPVKNVPIQ